MKLRVKILSGYVASLALVVLIGLWGVFNLWRLGKASEEILQENYFSIRAADSMVDALERQDSATLLLLLSSSADKLEEGLALFRDNEVSFLQALARAKDNVTTAEEPEALRALESSYKSYLASVDGLLSATDSSATAGLNKLDRYEQTIRPAFQIVRESAIRLRDINQTAMTEASSRTAIISQRAILSVAIAGFSAAVSGFVISWILSRNLARPVQAMRGATAQIADGNYDVQLAIASRDELGQLAEEINAMSKRLQAFNALNLDKVVAEKQRGEAIIHSLSDGIVVVDDQLHIIAINPVAAAIFGTKPGLAKGRHCLEIVENRTLYQQIQSAASEETAANANAADTALSGSGDPAELSLERGNRTEHYQYLATPVVAADRRRLGVVLLLQNVTNLKQLDQLKSEFVMTASHELRTPLTGMAMSIDLLIETTQGKLSEDEQALLTTAQEDVQRLRALVNDLLDLSKIESGKIDMAQAATRPDGLVSKAIGLLQIQANKNNVELVAQLSSNLPEVNADANKITWVLTNLIANALRYARSRIDVATQSHGTWVSISVVDDGPGIEPAYQRKIFDKFVQVKTEKDVGGTGLGLAICKEIVQAHGGRIWVESTPGYGSTFTFTLPIVSQSFIKKETAHATR